MIHPAQIWDAFLGVIVAPSSEESMSHFFRTIRRRPFSVVLKYLQRLQYQEKELLKQISNFNLCLLQSLMTVTGLLATVRLA